FFGRHQQRERKRNSGASRQQDDRRAAGPRAAEGILRAMKKTEISNLQAQLKEKYKQQPPSALITLRAKGRLGEGVYCSVEIMKALVEAGLHPATGGSGFAACSGDMLLQSLVACAGVTMNAVATALGIEIRD